MTRLGRRCVAGPSLNALTSSGTSTLVLPLLLGKKSCLGRPAMSVLVVQIKNRLKTQVMHIDVEKHGFFSLVPGKDAINLHDGARDSGRTFVAQGEAPGLYERQRRGSYSVYVEGRKGRHPRYSITIMGCTPLVYKVIGVGETDIRSTAGISITAQ